MNLAACYLEIFEASISSLSESLRFATINHCDQKKIYISGKDYIFIAFRIFGNTRIPYHPDIFSASEFLTSIVF